MRAHFFQLSRPPQTRFSVSPFRWKALASSSSSSNASASPPPPLHPSVVSDSSRYCCFSAPRHPPDSPLVPRISFPSSSPNVSSSRSFPFLLLYCCLLICVVPCTFSASLAAFKYTFALVSFTVTPALAIPRPSDASSLVNAATALFSNNGSEGSGGEGRRVAEDEEERNNWAVIVSTSRYWHNYRHTSNALTIYFAVKRLGIPDSRIILMVADDHACNPRNPFPGQIFNSPHRSFNLYGVTAPSAAAVKQRQAAFNEAAAAAAAAAALKCDASEGGAQRRGSCLPFSSNFSSSSFSPPSSSTFSSFSVSSSPPNSSSSSFSSPSSPSSASSFVSSLPAASLSEDVEVDYRGEEVHVQALMRLLTGRHAAETPRGQRLLSDSRSHVLVYLTGHGGENFLKFQDWEEIGAVDLADAVAQMQQQQRYKRLLLIAETCQGSTLLDSVYSPNVLGLASSKLDESSYSHHADSALGVSVVDRWTYYTLRFFRKHVFKGRGKEKGSGNHSTSSSFSLPSLAGGGHVAEKGGKRNNSSMKRQKNTRREHNRRGSLLTKVDEGDDDNDEDEEEEKEEEHDKSRDSRYRYDGRKNDPKQSNNGGSVEHKHGERGGIGEGGGRRRTNGKKPKTVADLLRSYKFTKLLSTATARTDLFDKSLEQTTLDEFFSAATGVVIPTLRPYLLPPPPETEREEESYEDKGELKNKEMNEEDTEEEEQKRLQQQQQQLLQRDAGELGQDLQQQRERRQQPQKQTQQVQQQQKRQQRQRETRRSKDIWREQQRRAEKSFPVFDVLPYYRESFLCLLCDNGEGLFLLQLPQKQEEQRRVGADSYEKKRAAGVAARGSTGTRRQVAVEKEEAAAATAALPERSVIADEEACTKRRSCRRFSAAERKVYMFYESDREGQQERLQQQQDSPERWSLPELLHITAAGAAALLAAAGVSSLV